MMCTKNSKKRGSEPKWPEMIKNDLKWPQMTTNDHSRDHSCASRPLPCTLDLSCAAKRGKIVNLLSRIRTSDLEMTDSSRQTTVSRSTKCMTTRFGARHGTKKFSLLSKARPPSFPPSYLLLSSRWNSPGAMYLEHRIGCGDKWPEEGSTIHEGHIHCKSVIIVVKESVLTHRRIIGF